MTLLNDLLQSLNPERQAAVLARCVVYRTKTPERVAYQSAGDAFAHESGYKNWPVRPFGKGYTPEFAGWQEAYYERRSEIQDQEAADEHNDARRAERGEEE